MRATVWLILTMSIAGVARSDRPQPGVSCSANSRFCAVEHNVEIPGVGGRVFSRITDNGSLVRDVPGCNTPLLTDDGRYFICAPVWRLVPLRIIRLADGAVIASKPIEDLLTENDLEASYRPPVQWTLREEAGSPPLLVFPMPANTEHTITEDVSVDIATGELLTPKHDIYPLPRVEIRSAGPTKRWGTPRCSGGPLPFEGIDVYAIDAKTLLENAVTTPLPEYPHVAKMARISGFVNVQIVVDDAANTCVRVGALPFGMDLTVEKAVRTWTFRPFRLGGKIRTVTSTFAIQFTLPD